MRRGYRFVVVAVFAVAGVSCGDGSTPISRSTGATSDPAVLQELKAAVEKTLAASTLRVRFCAEPRDRAKTCLDTDYRAPDQARSTDGSSISIENLSYNPGMDAPDTLPADEPMSDNGPTPSARYTRLESPFVGPPAAQFALGPLPGLLEEDPERTVRREGDDFIVTSKVWQPSHDSAKTTFDSEDQTVEIQTTGGYVAAAIHRGDDFSQSWAFSRFGEEVPAITPPPDDLVDEDIAVAAFCDEENEPVDETMVACTPRGEEDLPEPEGPTESTMQFRRVDDSNAECRRADENPPSGESARLADVEGACHKVGPTLLEVRRADIQVVLRSPTEASLRIVLRREDRRKLGSITRANEGREMGVTMFGVVLTHGKVYGSDYGGEVMVSADLPLASRVYAALVA